MALFLKADWEQIVMANYQIDPKYLIPYLPAGVEIDLFEDKCYISLVGFLFKNTKLFSIPVPFFGSFEEINLRFYVTRKDDTGLKRGVVFINETIPYAIVAWVANALYNEKYTRVPTRHQHSKTQDSSVIKFEWLHKKQWNSLQVEYANESSSMKEGTLEHFIFEHYYGYTKVSDCITEEYRLQHPSWNTHHIQDFAIACNFESMYGLNFKILNATTPTSIYIAQGSQVGIEWKRNQIKM